MASTATDLGPSDSSNVKRVAALHGSLIAAARDVGPLLSDHAAFADEELRLADAVVDELSARRLFQLWQPQRYGGLEVDVRTQIEVSAELAAHCPSAAWVTALYAACSFFAGLYSSEAQDEVFGGDKEARVCGVLAPSSKVREAAGGITVDGTWAYASGSEHATWATVGAPLVDGSGGTTLLLIPMRDLRIERTWDPTGMRGTASNTLSANDLFVPSHRVLPFFCAHGAIAGKTQTEHKDEALFRTPLGGFASACIVGPLIGMAKSALAYTLEHITGRSVAYTFANDQSALVSTQLAIADAATKIDTAELHIYRAADDLDRAAEGGEEVSLLVRARIRHDIGFATQSLREAMDIFQQINGSSDMARGRRFERLWRDFSTSNMHAALSPATTAEVYGKVLCGHDPSEFSALY